MNKLNKSMRFKDLSYLICDLETEDKEVYGRTANFMFNDVICVGMKNREEERVEYLECKLEDFKIDEEVFVAFNASFECLHLWKYRGFQEFLKNGGIIYDPSYVEYLLTGQQHKYPPLRDKVAGGVIKNPGVGRRYGCKERIKHIDRLLFNKKETLDKINQEIITPIDNQRFNKLKEEQLTISAILTMRDIPKELVIEDCRNDIRDTEIIYLKQLELIAKEGMESLVRVLCDCLLSTTEMTFNGFHVDKEVLNKNRQKVQEELQTRTAEALELVMRHWK